MVSIFNTGLDVAMTKMKKKFVTVKPTCFLISSGMIYLKVVDDLELNVPPTCSSNPEWAGPFSTRGRMDACFHSTTYGQC